MSNKFHINAKGEPGVCRAQHNCPFGGEGEHYDTQNEARAAYEEKAASEFGQVSSFSKSSTQQTKTLLPPRPHRTKKLIQRERVLEQPAKYKPGTTVTLSEDRGFAATGPLLPGTKVTVNEHGMPHSYNDKPSVVLSNRTVYWYNNGSIGRPSNPQMPNKMQYYPNGKRKTAEWIDATGKQRDSTDNVPSYMEFHENGKKKLTTYVKDGVPHREGGPAYVEHDANGKFVSAEWRQNGNFERPSKTPRHAPTRITANPDGSSTHEFLGADGLPYREDGLMSDLVSADNELIATAYMNPDGSHRIVKLPAPLPLSKDRMKG